MYPKIEKVFKDHATTAGLVKDKQSDRAEIISNYTPLKVVLGQVTGKTCKHPPNSLKTDAGCPRLSASLENIVLFEILENYKQLCQDIFYLC